MNHQEEIDNVIKNERNYSTGLTKDLTQLDTARLSKFDLRDHMALFAMRCLINKDPEFANFIKDMDEGHEPQQGLAEQAYKIADAMLNERQNTKYSHTEYPKYDLPKA